MIDIRSGRILIDGQPQLIMAGEVHYFRTPRDQWGARLDLLRDAGCTCVASYIPWLFHELPDGTIDLDGRTRPERDLAAFVDLCAERGLTFFARPGPFVMAELKNEGLPYRLYREYPQIVPVGWDGAPATSRTVDYLAEAFLTEVDRWYAAVMPILAARLQPCGGPVVGVQLDNEIGMLAWVTNTPDLTDGLVADLRTWCAGRYEDGLDARYPVEPGAEAWLAAVRSPDERWAAALRVDLGHFMRDRFARYVDRLAQSARAYGIEGVPFMINIHGTEGGDGVPFAIGVSQLYETYAGRPGFVAGSDHYLGEITAPVAADLHFINAAMAAVNGPDQPLTSLEFEAGTGDYSGGLDSISDPATVDLKVRLCLAQGNRMINYYLLAGGVNPPLDAAVGDGNDRISFTGERHGVGAPISPEGDRGLAYAATARVTHAARLHSTWLADHVEEHDDLAVGFWADAFMTEYHHPRSAVMTAVVDDLVAFRGPGPRKALWRSMLFAGFRFGAVNLADPAARLPRTVALSVGRVLDADVQRRLADHVRGGGLLLLTGRVPEVDTENRACSILAEALGVSGGAVQHGSEHYYPSVTGHGVVAGMAETRVGWIAELSAPQGRKLFGDVDGRTCGVRVEVGDGAAIVVTTELPAMPEVFSTLLADLGCTPGLALRTSVPGVIATTTRGTDGGRLLHLINPTGFAASVEVDEGISGRPLELPARAGVILPLGVRVAGATLVAANAELASVDGNRLRFSRPLGDRTEVWLRTDRQVVAEDVIHRDGLTLVTAGPGRQLEVDLR